MPDVLQLAVSAVRNGSPCRDHMQLWVMRQLNTTLHDVLSVTEKLGLNLVEMMRFIYI